jgi:hypothetical protein
VSMPNLPTAGQAGRYALDLAERVAMTFIQAFLASLIAGGWFDVDQIRNLSIPQKAAVAGLAAVLALIKGIMARFVGSPDSASTAPGI